MTLERLKATLADRGVLMLHDGLFPSVTTLVAGEVVRGSWWGHPRGKAIFAVAEQLLDDPDVVSLKLLSGKDTLVHRRLWHGVLSAVANKEPWQIDGLSEEDLRMLDSVERADVDATGASAKRLATRLLARAARLHTEQGHHATRLESWARWAAREGVLVGDRAEVERAVDAACPGGSARLGWTRAR